MSFLNLNLAELLGLVSAVSAGIVALYLLDRSRRKHMVATLRFWSAGDARTELKRRRRVQQPWSLLLQLISLILLLFAIAEPKLGSLIAGRDHVLVIDTSAWMASRDRQGTLMDEAKVSARDYVRSLSSFDRVMLVHADALATPVTAFEQDRSLLEDAIRRTQPGASSLNLPQALEFAEKAQKLQGRRPGEIVFAGAALIPEADAAAFALPANLRLLQVGTPQENVGLRKVGARRSPASPGTWEIFVAVRNYGQKVHDVDLELQFAKSPAGSKHLTLAPGAEEQTTFSYRSPAGGFLEVRLNSKDAFPQDDRTLLELPPQASLHAVVYSNQPQLLRPLIASNPQMDAVFEPTAQYKPDVKADLVILDQFAPPQAPKANALWIQPPQNGSPIPVRVAGKPQRLLQWRTDTALGAGLHSQGVTVENAEVFQASADDIIVADGAEGPLVVARESSGRGPKIVVVGFEPSAGVMRYELATPLLIANAIRWMAPGAFRRWEIQAGTVGTVSLPVDKSTVASQVRVLDDRQRPLPFTLEKNELRFFDGAPGTVRLLIGEREMVYSLTLPDIADVAWKAPAGVKRGISGASNQASAGPDLWPWLALLAGIGLLADWLIYGRTRAFRFRSSLAASGLGAKVSSWKSRISGSRTAERKAS